MVHQTIQHRCSKCAVAGKGHIPFPERQIGSKNDGSCFVTLGNHLEYFYRTSNGAEIDLVLEKGQQRIAVEIKSSTAPKVSRGFWNAIEDLNSTANYVIAPVESGYPLAKNVRVMNLAGFVTELLR